MTRSLRIAVADDEPDVRDYFARILPRLGHQVVGAASNGRELVELCRQTQPDLIITDVRMPDMAGNEALRQIHESRPVPFILVSADSGPAVCPDGLGDCGWAYLNKPVNRGDLAAAIARAARRLLPPTSAERPEETT